MIQPITQLQKEDFRLIALLHQQSLPHAFLSKLGVGFLSAFYQKIHHSKHGYICVLKEDNLIIGFVAASSHVSQLKKDILKNPMPLLLAATPLLLNGKVLKGLFDHLFHRKNKIALSTPNAELLSMAVHENYRNKHFGSLLFDLTSQYIKGAGETAFVVMVGKKLIESQQFYERKGAEIIGELQLHRDNESLLYICKV